MIPIYIMSGAKPFQLDYLCIAGGGGGGQDSGAGGGGGGYLASMPGEQSGGPSSSLAQLTYFGGESITIQVGAGGGVNSNGTNSIFGDLTAIGGGKGGNGISSTKTAGDGGSGGGSQAIAGVARSPPRHSV